MQKRKKTLLPWNTLWFCVYASLLKVPTLHFSAKKNATDNNCNFYNETQLQNFIFFYEKWLKIHILMLPLVFIRTVCHICTTVSDSMWCFDNPKVFHIYHIFEEKHFNLDYFFWRRVDGWCGKRKMDLCEERALERGVFFFATSCIPVPGQLGIISNSII